MATEIEAKFIVEGYGDLRNALARAGAVCTQPRTLMRRRIFDYPDLRLDATAAWVRVRDEGARTVLSYKQRQSETLSGMAEHETTVGSFDETCAILERIGLVEKAYQESYRETWSLEGNEIALDEWPWLPYLVEVEATDEATVGRLAETLGLDWSQAITDSVDGVYLRYYDVSRREASTVKLTFEVEPKLFQERRRAGVVADPERS